MLADIQCPFFQNLGARKTNDRLARSGDYEMSPFAPRQFRCAIPIEICLGGRTARIEIRRLMLQIDWDIRCWHKAAVCCNAAFLPLLNELQTELAQSQDSGK